MADLSYEHKTSDRKLWFSILSGPVSWTVYFVVLYSLGEVACNLGFMQGEWFGRPAIVGVALLLGALTLLVNVAGGWIANGLRRQGRQRDLAPQDARRMYFSGLIGLLMNAGFALAAIMLMVIVLLLPAC